MKALTSLLRRATAANATVSVQPLIVTAVAITAISTTTSTTATAANLYDSGGFEATRFVAPLNLEGQDDPSLGGQGPWQKDTGTSTATVQTNFPQDGLQSVRVERDGTATGDTRWGVVKPFTPSSSSSILSIDVDMRVLVSADPDPSTPDFGPLFGIEAYDASSGTPKLIGGLTLDAGSGDVLYRATRTGDWLATGRFLPRNEYHHYTLTADFDRKRYSIFVDGDLLHTERFVERTANAFTDAPIVTLAAGAAAETGIAYFDNYAISFPSAAVAAVPEPGAAAGLVLAAIAMAARRRPRHYPHP